MKRFFLLILSVPIFFGCAAGTIRGSIGNPDFQQANLPIRTVRVLIVAKDNKTLKKGEKTIENVSALIEPQAGIRFVVVRTLTRKDKFSSDRIEALNELLQTCKKAGLERGEHFDIAFGISEYTFSDFLAWLSPLPVVTWEGVIDNDLCRCYLVTKTDRERVNAHELMHSFIPDFEHDKAGLMTDVTFRLFPRFSMGGKDMLYLSPRARESVLKHKWRDLSKLPIGH